MGGFDGSLEGYFMGRCALEAKLGDSTLSTRLKMAFTDRMDRAARGRTDAGPMIRRCASTRLVFTLLSEEFATSKMLHDALKLGIAVWYETTTGLGNFALIQTTGASRVP